MAAKLRRLASDRDLFIALGTQNRKATEVSVGEIMHAEPSVCAPRDELRHALEIMETRRIRRLAVVDDGGCLQGVLSIDDIVVRSNGALKDAHVVRALKAICGYQTHCVGKE